MSRLTLAFRMFFATLFGSVAVEQGRALLEGPSSAAESKAERPPAAKPRAASPRSDAITLLAMLQREARLVDLIQEPLNEYSDEQIGAAARGVLGDSATVLERVFQLQRVVDADDNAELETPAEFSVGRYRLTGSVSGSGPFRGRLMHHGWIASRCELPQWTGEQDDARIIAPAELIVES